MREKLQRFMMGRYGVDSFGKFLTGAILFLIVVSFFWKTTGLNLVLLFGIAYSYFRMLSRNYAKRLAENQKYMQMTAGIRNWIGKSKRNAAQRNKTQRNTAQRNTAQKNTTQKNTTQRKQFKYFTCPKCGKKVRVPKGRGKICITCPECNHEFVKKS
jgi:ATPase subunit of ABC transporter with duplicated ATPase domains